MNKIFFGTQGELYFWCPACDKAHGLHMPWQFNGDPVKPTMSPSVRFVNGSLFCHSAVNDGQITYLQDTTHDAVGQTLDLPDYPPLGRLSAKPVPDEGTAEGAAP